MQGQAGLNICNFASWCQKRATILLPNFARQISGVPLQGGILYRGQFSIKRPWELVKA